jgi:hypothetical protein
VDDDRRDIPISAAMSGVDRPGVLRLSDVLARRGRLAPAEVVTLVVALALDLADWHDAGRTHGAVCPEAVVFAPDGRPYLDDPNATAAAGPAQPLTRAVLVSPEVARGGAAGPAADVFAVAAIGHWALAGQPPWPADDPDRAYVRAAGASRTPLAELARSAPAPLVDALEAGLTGDPAARCGARELAEAVLAAGPAAPLRLALPAATPPVAVMPTAVRAPLVSRRLVAAAVLGIVIVGGGAAAALSRPATRAEQPARTRPARTLAAPTLPARTLPARTVSVADHTSWRAVLAGFDEVRATALTDRRPALLLDIYAAGSPLLARDVALIGELDRRGLTLRGRLSGLSSPRASSVSADGAVLSAVELPAAYLLVDRHGHVVLRVQGDRARRVVVHLRRTRDGWRVVTVD